VKEYRGKQASEGRSNDICTVPLCQIPLAKKHYQHFTVEALGPYLNDARFKIVDIKMEKLRDDTGLAQKIAANAYNDFMEKYTWRARAQSVLAV
jgi:hypothetical protein